jgi:hypothetical protein
MQSFYQTKARHSIDQRGRSMASLRLRLCRGFDEWRHRRPSGNSATKTPAASATPLTFAGACVSGKALAAGGQPLCFHSTPEPRQTTRELEKVQ